ncbi:MAG: 2-keto-4-pentenoate hydratase [Rubrivivax sp.]
MKPDAVGALASRLMQAWDRASLAPLPSSSPEGFDLPAAWQVASELFDQRRARGEVVAGWKIGFTNRSIWERYGVHAPIWGPVWQGGLTQLDAPQASIRLDGLSQPRLEPEIVFGLCATPRADMSLQALQGCIEWVAHGVEIVHTHFADWRFTAPDTVADFALHGRLLVGPRAPGAGGGVW